MKFIYLLFAFLLFLCTSGLYAQESTGLDAHDLSVKVAEVAIVLFLIALAIIYYSKKKKK